MKITTSNPPAEPTYKITYPAHFKYIDCDAKSKASFIVLAFAETTGIVVQVDKNKKARNVGDFVIGEWIPFSDTSSWKPIKMTSTFEG